MLDANRGLNKRQKDLIDKIQKEIVYAINKYNDYDTAYRNVIMMHSDELCEEFFYRSPLNRRIYIKAVGLNEYIYQLQIRSLTAKKIDRNNINPGIDGLCDMIVSKSELSSIYKGNDIFALSHNRKNLVAKLENAENAIKEYVAFEDQIKTFLHKEKECKTGDYKGTYNIKLKQIDLTLVIGEEQKYAIKNVSLKKDKEKELIL